MIAIRPLAGDMQEQIDLGRRESAASIQAGRRRKICFSLAIDFGLRNLGSGFSPSARCH